jgi:hypothetical protein
MLLRHMTSVTFIKIKQELRGSHETWQETNKATLQPAFCRLVTVKLHISVMCLLPSLGTGKKLGKQARLDEVWCDRDTVIDRLAASNMMHALSEWQHAKRFHAIHALLSKMPTHTRHLKKHLEQPVGNSIHHSGRTCQSAVVGGL